MPNYVTRWSLTPGGNPFTTATSHLLPVIYNQTPAMLKIATEAEEGFGGGLLPWWNGDGAEGATDGKAPRIDASDPK